MSQLRIQQLFEARLKAWADDQGIQVAFPNVDFTPPDELYIRADLLKGTPTSQTLETSTTYVGVFQMSIYASRNQGAGPAGEIAAQLATLFPCDSKVVGEDGFTVSVTSPLDEPTGFADGVRWITPTSFNYRADVALTQ
jgi:hypothetical protein